LIGSLRQARSKGIHVVRASRTGSGIVVRNGGQPDDDYDWLAAGDQVAHKARLLMMVALSTSAAGSAQHTRSDTAALQRILQEY
jgi:glutamin-(asparagin-)ase